MGRVLCGFYLGLDSVMKLALLALVVSSSVYAHDEEHPTPIPPVVTPMSSSCTDCWNGEDKKIHFAVSAVAGLAAVNQWPESKWKAFGVAMIPGFLKEVSDIKGSGFSGKDLAADALGAAFGVLGGGWMITNTKVTYETKF